MSSDSDSGYSSDEGLPRTPRLNVSNLGNKPSYDEESNIHSDITLDVTLPGDKKVELKVSVGNTIFNIKKNISDNHDLPFEKLVIQHEGKTLLDPLSLNDFPSIASSGKASLIVTLH